MSVKESLLRELGWLISKWFIRLLRSPKYDRQPKRTSMNLLDKEWDKSRQRHKDVNAVLSASKHVLKPNAFDYINSSKSERDPKTQLTTIHNGGFHRPTRQARVTFRPDPYSCNLGIRIWPEGSKGSTSIPSLHITAWTFLFLSWRNDMLFLLGLTLRLPDYS